jgi:hypothetical protein
MLHNEADKIDLETLQRHYADVTAWLVRLSRYYEPARPAETSRIAIPPRILPPSRHDDPARPW